MTTAPTTTTLADFLAARLDEDEAAARAVLPLDYAVDMGGNRLDERWYVARLKFSSADGAARSEQDDDATQLFARHDPARVLAEVASKRAIVEMHHEYLGVCTHCVLYNGELQREPWPCPILRHLAAIYESHPDYDEAWRL